VFTRAIARDVSLCQYDKGQDDRCAGVARLILKKPKMDPARPNDPDPADPFNPERADHAVLETIEIATEGEDCDDCVRKLRPVLKKIAGVKDVKVDLKHERVIVTFDARKTHPPDLHDAILKSGYKPGPTAD
jgi:copper chaperone CopZ